MSGRIAISSGTEDLTSVSAEALGASLEGNGSDEAYLSLFNAAGAEQSSFDASAEALNTELPSKFRAGEGCDDAGCCEKRPPLVSKVIDANGHAYISILWDGHPFTGGGNSGVVVGLLNAASENDVVDITIMTALHNFNQTTTNIFSTLSLLNAIQQCKAKVITRIGCFTSIGDCAMWLSGDDRRVSPMAWLAVRQPRMNAGGTMRDVEFRIEDIKVQFKSITDFIVEKGLLTQEEIDRMYDDQAMIGMSYDELDARLQALKA